MLLVLHLHWEWLYIVSDSLSNCHVHYHGSCLISHKNTDSSRRWESMVPRSLVAKHCPYVVQTIYFICTVNTLHNIIQLFIQLWIPPLSPLVWIILSALAWRCIGLKAALPGYVTETMIFQKFLLSLCTTVTPRSGTSWLATGLNAWWLSPALAAGPYPPLQSHFIYLHSFLQLGSSWFSFSLAPLCLNTSKSNIKDLAHNPSCQHATQSIS